MNVFLNLGRANVAFVGTDTVFNMKTVDGDKTGKLFVENEQIVIHEYIEGRVTSTTTEFHMIIEEDAILQVNILLLVL